MLDFSFYLEFVYIPIEKVKQAVSLHKYVGKCGRNLVLLPKIMW
jgi:hypothetical protein